MVEKVEVTISVPKDLLKLLEAENYFGWNKQDFFAASVIRSVDIEVHDLDYQDEEKLREKYGEDVGTLYIEIDKATKLRKLA